MPGADGLIEGARRLEQMELARALGHARNLDAQNRMVLFYLH